MRAMPSTEARRAAAWQRAAPYLGIACLALLALSGAALSGAATSGTSGVQRGVSRAGRQTPALPAAWLAGPLAAPALLGPIQTLAAGTGGLAHTVQPSAALAAAQLPQACRPASASISPFAGALAVPALLVAINLARCH